MRPDDSGTSNVNQGDDCQGGCFYAPSTPKDVGNAIIGSSVGGGHWSVLKIAGNRRIQAIAIFVMCRVSQFPERLRLTSAWSDSEGERASSCVEVSAIEHGFTSIWSPDNGPSQSLSSPAAQNDIDRRSTVVSDTRGRPINLAGFFESKVSRTYAVRRKRLRLPRLAAVEGQQVNDVGKRCGATG